MASGAMDENRLDWSRPINLYCERTDPSFWAEPINALSNCAFLIAAILAFIAWNSMARRDGAVLVLIVLTGAIGVGSFIFHTVATAGAELFDTVPIGIFIYFYLFLALRRFLILRPMSAVAVLLLFAAASYAETAVVPPGSLNGSHTYLPALLAMLAIGLLAQAPEVRQRLLVAAGLFTLSLVFRSIDAALCYVWPLGTHFIWHCLNAAVLYLLLKTAMSQPRSKSA